ncbi:MAG: proton-conducting transporter membrane subunit [Angelakisella sp.]
MINWFHNLPFFCIFIAMVAGMVTPFLRSRVAARAVHLTVLGVSLACSVVLLCYTLGTGESFTYMVGHYPAPWGNELRAGPLEAAMALMFSLVMLLSMLGNGRSLQADVEDSRQPLYYVMMNMLFSSLLALIYTNDLFTAYVFIEINTITACAIVMAKNSKETIRATLRYLIMSLLGSGLILIAIALLYDLSGHLLMSPMHTALTQMAARGEYLLPLTVAVGLLTIGLSVKSALYPFHSWLPDAHASATTTSSSILSGLVVKGYILLLLKFYCRVLGLELFAQLGIANLLFVLGGLGMIMGSLNALRQKNIKRMIAFSSVAQVGYIFLGIGLQSPLALAAACLHIIVHAVTKPMLFTAAGALIDAAGHQKKLQALRGTAWQQPVAGIAMLFGGFSMIGLPLLAGFSSKLALAQAAFVGNRLVLPTLLLLGLSSILNALYYIPMLLVIYTPREPGCKMQWRNSLSLQSAVLLVLVVCNVAVGVCYTPLMNILKQGIALLG